MEEFRHKENICESKVAHPSETSNAFDAQQFVFSNRVELLNSLSACCITNCTRD